MVWTTGFLRCCNSCLLLPARTNLWQWHVGFNSWRDHRSLALPLSSCRAVTRGVLFHQSNKQFSTVTSHNVGRTMRTCCSLYQNAFKKMRNGITLFRQPVHNQTKLHCSSLRRNCTTKSVELHQSYKNILCTQNFKGFQIVKRFNSGTKTNFANGRKTKLPPKAEVKRLLALAKPEKWKLTGAILLLVVSSSVTMAVPFCMGKVIDIIYTSMEDGTMVEKLTYICKILVGVFLMGAIANFGRVYLMQTSGNRIVKKIREQLFSSIMKQEVAFFDKTKTGELINRLSTDTSLVGQSITLNISDGLRSTAQAIGGISMMFFVSPKLATIALGIVPPVAAMSILYGRYVRKITKNVQDSLAEATQVAEERIGNIRTVRAFAQEGKELNSYNKRITEVLNLSYKEALARGIFWGSTGLSGNLIVLSVFYYGGLMMTESQITVGDLSAFLLYAAYVGVSIGGLSSFYTELMRGLGASTRLWELTDKPPLIPLTDGIVPPTEPAWTIQFRDLGFSYPSRPDTPIFSGLNLTVPQGSIMAVVGPSGSGKSTLAALLLRYYNPNSGSILIDEYDINTLNPSWLRSNMGTVSQEPALFSCSVRENIAYGASDPSSVTEEDLVDAARKANAYGFIQHLPQGMDTLVGERGILLSGGQKQRIAIARAILKNPKVLLLDEATSALDAESEFLVQEALERLMVGRTVITIAHRLSTIKNADQIAVLDQGHIVEVGSYDQLTKLENGMFKKLVERQTIVST